MLYAALKVSYKLLYIFVCLYVLGKYRVGITMVFEDLNLSSVKGQVGMPPGKVFITC